MAFNLKDIQLSNPRFLARHKEYEAKVKAEEEKRQKDERYKKDKIEQLKYTKEEFDNIIMKLYGHLESNFPEGLVFSNIYKAEESINPLKNLYIKDLINKYESYCQCMTDIQSYFNQEARDAIESSYNYDKHYKDCIIKLTNDLYEKIGIVQGFIYPSIIHEIRDIFNVLEKYGGPRVELFIDIDTDILRRTYNDTKAIYDNYPEDIVDIQVKEVLGYNLEDIHELELMKN